MSRIESTIRRYLAFFGGGSSKATPEVSPEPVLTTAIKPRQKTKKKPRIVPIPQTRTRWFQSDIELAIQAASTGDLSLIGQLCRAMNRDGTIQGLMGTRTGGLVRLPKMFRGTDESLAVLDSKAGCQGLFDKIFPQAELEALLADGIKVKVGVAEFVKDEVKQYPVLTRLDPEFLRYNAHEDQYYYLSRDGLIPVNPGDGRWVLYLPAGRYEPWNSGAWQALARAFVSKDHNFLNRENYNDTLANPARVAVMPNAAGEEQKVAWFQQVAQWAHNTVYGVTPGYDVKLVESSGKGVESFKDTIATADQEIMFVLTGQTVTSTGGVGFANASVFDSIRTDLVQGDGNSLAACLNEQALPHVIADFVGEGHEAFVSWDTKPPADLKKEAEAMGELAEAIKSANEALKTYGKRVNAYELATRYGLPLLSIEEAPKPSPDNDPTIPRAPKTTQSTSI